MFILFYKHKSTCMKKYQLIKTNINIYVFYVYVDRKLLASKNCIENA